MRALRFWLVVPALLCVLVVPAFAAEPEYTYEFSDENFPPEYASISCDGDMITIQLETAFFDAFAPSLPLDAVLSLLSTLNWAVTVNGEVIPGAVFDWSVGSAIFPYSGDGLYSVSSDNLNERLDVNIVRVPASSDSASVPGILSSVSAVFAAVLGLLSLFAAAVVVHPILLIGVIFGLLGVAIAIFRRLFI